MKNIKFILVFLSITFFISCAEDEGYEEYTVETSNVEDVSGDWYVQAYLGEQLVVDYFLITTSNTNSDDGNLLQIYDHLNFWWFNVPVPFDPSTLTFSGQDIESRIPDDPEDYVTGTTVANGVITPNGTTSTGTEKTVDKIEFDIQFDDDSSSRVFHFVGYKRTGFLEDEH